MSNQSAIRVRFAPSPTGHLHVGSARTALFNWLFARHHGGAFVMRIEDTDLERSKQEYTHALIQSLAWLGITSDEPLFYQSNERARYAAYVEQLLAEGKAYKCYCSSEELEARLVTHQTYGKLYDRKCRVCCTQPADVPYAVRFKIPDNVQDISFHDLILGDISVSVNQLDDFIIARSDGMPVYNFVVVIDDAYMRISHVIRAQEHLNNTPKQLLLYQALGFEVPQFAHIPLILGKSGQKLSKREGATAITEYQAMGFLPDALLNYLARLGWAHGDQEIFSRDELISFFSLEHVGKSGAIFDIEKLRWVNAEHIKRMAAQDLLAALVRDVAPDFTRDRSTDVLLRMIELYKTRVSTLAELVSEINLVMNGPQEYENAAVIAWFGESAREHVRVVCELLRDSASWQTHDLETTVRDYAKQHALPLATLAQPVRIALVGKTTSPGVFHLLEVLGKEKSIERLEALLKLSS